MEISNNRLLIVSMLALMAASVSISFAQDSCPPTDMQDVTVYLAAENTAFNESAIEVPAGASVTVVFINNDEGVRHNFAVYESESQAGDEDATIFQGEVITGVDTAYYSFTAPEDPDTYYFQCDVHPRMNGEFIVSET